MGHLSFDPMISGIEFRWLRRGDWHEDSLIERTLQYRVQKRAIIDRDDPPCGRLVWTEWINVPEAE